MNRSYFTADGTITLPEDVVQQLALQPHTPVHVFAEGNQIVVQPINAAYFETLRGLLIGEGLSADVVRETKTAERAEEERKLSHLFPSGT